MGAEVEKSENMPIDFTVRKIDVTIDGRPHLCFDSVVFLPGGRAKKA